QAVRLGPQSLFAGRPSPLAATCRLARAAATHDVESAVDADAAVAVRRSRLCREPSSLAVRAGAATLLGHSPPRSHLSTGTATPLLFLSAVPLLFNPAVFSQYIDALRQHTPEHWVTPTLGTLLRQFFGWERFWLQFVPPLIGASWFVIYWWRKRRSWDWRTRLPLVVIVS